jgi:hypothetical protein
MFKNVIRAAVFILAGASTAIADSTVGDWTISHHADNKDQCVAVRNYDARQGNNQQNTVILSLLRGKIIVGLGYYAWKWDNGDRADTSLSLDGNEVAKKVEWTAAGPQALAGIPRKTDLLMSALAVAKKLSVKFDDGHVVEFDIPKAGEVLAALQACVEGK